MKKLTDHELTESGNKTAIIDRIVSRLNEQQLKTMAGFYGLGSRFFRARRVKDTLEVYDFETWRSVDLKDAVFHDHNGQDISLPKFTEANATIAPAKPVPLLPADRPAKKLSK